MAIPVLDLLIWQYVYTVSIVEIAPLLGVALIVVGRNSVGTWLVLLSGLASFAYQGLFHFVIVNPDHVAMVESGQAVFGITAALATGGDALMALAAGWVIWHQARGGSTPSSTWAVR